MASASSTIHSDKKPPQSILCDESGLIEKSFSKPRRVTKPYKKIGFISKLFFLWINPLAHKCWRGPIDQYDLRSLDASLHPRQMTEKICKDWKDWNSTSRNSLLYLVLTKFAGLKFVWTFILECFSEFFFLLNVEALSQFTGCLKSSSDAVAQPEKAMMFAVLMFILNIAHFVCKNQTELYHVNVSISLQMSLKGIIYERMLSLSSADRHKYSLGKLVPLTSSSLNRVDLAVPFVHYFVFAPIQVSIIIGWIGSLIGIKPTLMVIGLFVACVPLQWLVMNKMSRQRELISNLTDERIKYLQEAILGIKTIKYNGWEPIFLKKIQKLRDKEIKAILRNFIYLCCMIFLNICIPTMSSVIVYCFWEREAGKTFVWGELMKEKHYSSIVVLLDRLENPLWMIPNMITYSINGIKALERVRKFISIDGTTTTKGSDVIEMIDDAMASMSLKIENCDFNWEIDDENAFDDDDDDEDYEKDAALLCKDVATSPTAMAAITTATKQTSPPQTPIHLSPQLSLTVPVAVEEDCPDRLITASPNTVYDTVDGVWTKGPSHAASAEFDQEDEDSSAGTLIFEGLKNIDCSFEKGSLTAIVGPVGSGKSSLLAAIYGEMKAKNDDGDRGSIVVNGTVGLCPQVSWIISGTIRENILVGLPFKADKYWKTMEECQMIDDLASLPFSDLTKIGEGGINLSGGQKARVNLARMVYSSRDIALLDDPLSAVDNRVGRAIFEKCILGGQLLKDKTRVLVTHHLAVLPRCDHIIVMGEGRIVAQGTYKSIISGSSGFSKLISACNEEKDGAKEEEEDEAAEGKTTKDSTNTTTTEDGKSKEYSTEEHVDDDFLGNDGINDPLDFNVYYIYFYAAGGMAILYLALGATLVNETIRSMRDLLMDIWFHDAFKMKPYHYLILYCCLAFSQPITTFLSGIVYFRLMGYPGSIAIHDRAMKSLMGTNLKFFESTPVGHIINRFGRDLDMVDHGVADELWYFLYALSSMCGSFILQAYLQPVMVILIFLPITFGLMLQSVFRAAARQIQRLFAIVYNPLMAAFTETYLGLSPIHAFGYEAYFRKKQYDAMYLVAKASYIKSSLKLWVSLYCEIICSILLLGSALYSAYFDVEASTASVIYSVLSCISGSLRTVIASMGNLEINLLAVQRLDQYSKELEDEEQSVAVPFDVNGEKRISDQELMSWPTQARIVFEDLELSYIDGGKPVLKGLTMSFEGGERVGIVGRTGAGKSSIIAALLRTARWSGGHITIDGINIGHLGLSHLRSSICVIPQEPFMFSGTLRFNLDPMQAYSDKEIWTALGKAGLHTVAKSLPGALDFKCLDLGENFSIGQRQLFCFTRALLRKAKIVLMDEATASMDIATDERIQRCIRKYMVGCTIITIAHRLATIKDYDRIVVLDSGRILEIGSPKELLANSSSHLSSLFKSELGK